MRFHRLQRWLTIGVLLALPALLYAQGEATLRGTVTDSTGGALPGVTVRAVHTASGNSFEAVTGERGTYRLPMRVGAYQVTAELAGFAPGTRILTLLAGQQGVVDFQMALSGLQESVTVTGEAPLLDVTASSLGGNIDPRQMQELPVNGRGWMDLVTLAPGARVTATAGTPTTLQGEATQSRGDFQVNVDGQQVTNVMSPTTGPGGQPQFSRDAIAEFEFVSSRFDATQGRSAGVQVNAITKSGTNTPSGSFSGYFRDDSLIAKDFVAQRVLRYQDQQLSWTFGGPIRRDRVHIFGHYELERNPHTAIFTTPYPHFNRDLAGTRKEHKGGARLDVQFSAQLRLTARGGVYRFDEPVDVIDSGITTPMAADGLTKRQEQILATFTQVISNRAVNEIKGGYSNSAHKPEDPHQKPSRYRLGTGGPQILLQGLSVGGGGRSPAPGKPSHRQTMSSIRDDFTYSRGSHTLKTGAEYIHLVGVNDGLGNSNGVLDARGGPVPANIESLFPDLFDANTWNLAPLSPISRSWRQGFESPSTHFIITLPREIFAAWFQDDWELSRRLTLNLGLRYDLEANALAQEVELLPWMTGDRPSDTNNVEPRLGFAFTATDRLVVRGGWGLYFGTAPSGYFTKHPAQQITPDNRYDGRADYASNPWNGPEPSYETVKARLCTPALAPGCQQNQTTNGAYAPDAVMPFSHQTSIGLQQQFGDTMGIEVDYLYSGLRKQTGGIAPNVNLTYNPATGANYPNRDVNRRFAPWWGPVLMRVSDINSNLHSLQTSWTKRMSGGWQASGTYTLSGLRDRYPRPLSGVVDDRVQLVPFPVAPDLGGEWSLAFTDQRHRAVVNGIWEVGYGFQVSGLYFFGSGERRPRAWGTDLRGIGGTLGVIGIAGGTGFEMRLRPDGTIVKRNDFVGKPVHRVDLRVQRRFPLRGRAAIDGLVEVFNAFNHANFGNYVITEVSRNFGAPQQNGNVAYAPRTLQLGFRFAF